MRQATDKSRKAGAKLIFSSRPEVFRRREDTEMEICLYFPEMTWKCPLNDWPDFARITLWYIPEKPVLELKSLKLWLNSFRDKNIGHEKLAAEIFETIWALAQPKSLRMHLDINPRGNLKSDIRLERKR